MFYSGVMCDTAASASRDVSNPHEAAVGNNMASPIIYRPCCMFVCLSLCSEHKKSPGLLVATLVCTHFS